MTLSQKHDQQKKLIRDKMGTQIYDKVYKILQMHKERDSDGQKIYEDLRPVTKHSGEVKDLVFALE